VSSGRTIHLVFYESGSARIPDCCLRHLATLCHPIMYLESPILHRFNGHTSFSPPSAQSDTCRNGSLPDLESAFLVSPQDGHRAVPALGWPRYLQSGALNWAIFTSQLLVVLERPDEHASFRSAKEKPCGGIGRTRGTSLCRAELVAPRLAGQQTDSWLAHSRRLGNQIHLLLDGDEDAKHALCDRTVHGQAAPGDCTCDPDDAW
jgi:hypothetical protein